MLDCAGLRFSALVPTERWVLGKGERSMNAWQIGIFVLVLVVVGVPVLLWEIDWLFPPSEKRKSGDKKTDSK